MVLILWSLLGIAGLLWTLWISYSVFPDLTENVRNASGFSATVTGLLVGVFGFGITFWQLWRTRKAAGAAEEAVSRLKQDFASFDVILELRTARVSGAEAGRHVNSGRWLAALVSLDQVRESLQKMLGVRNGLEIRDAERAKDYIAYALGACSSIEHVERAGGDISRTALTGKLRELDGYLIELEGTLKDRFSG